MWAAWAAPLVLDEPLFILDGTAAYNNTRLRITEGHSNTERAYR